MYTMKEAAQFCQVDYQKFYLGVAKYKVIPRPTHQYGESRRRYYTKSEVEEMKLVFDKYREDQAKREWETLKKRLMTLGENESLTVIAT